MVGPRHGWKKIETYVPKLTYSFEWHKVEKRREKVKVRLGLERENHELRLGGVG